MVSIVYLSKKIGARESTVPTLTASASISFGSAVAVEDRPVQVPTGFFVDSFTATTITLDWDDNPESDLASYTLQWTDDGNYPTFVNQQVGIVGSGFLVTGLLEGVLYHFRVRAHETSGRFSDWSPEITQSTNPTLAFHDRTGFQLDASGYTDINILLKSAAYVSASIAYVDPTGGNDGTAQTYNQNSFSDLINPVSPNAYQSFAAAKAAVGAGAAAVLFKRNESFGNLNPKPEAGAS